MIEALMARIEAGHYPDEEDRQAHVDRLANQYGCTVEVATDDVLLLDLQPLLPPACSRVPVPGYHPPAPGR